MRRFKLHIARHTVKERTESRTENSKAENCDYNADEHEDKLSLCPVVEGLFLCLVACPYEQHYDVDDPADNRNEVDEITENVAACRYGFSVDGSLRLRSGLYGRCIVTAVLSTLLFDFCAAVLTES